MRFEEINRIIDQLQNGEITKVNDPTVSQIDASENKLHKNLDALEELALHWSQRIERNEPLTVKQSEFIDLIKTLGDTVIEIKENLRQVETPDIKVEISRKTAITARKVISLNEKK
jgi:hypothetical protein